jgi:sec-independent protein translocase protein TatA
MGGIGWKEILFIGLIVMLFFGAKRLPELARSLRKSVDEFKKGGDDDDSDSGKDGSPNGSSTKSSKNDTASKN